MPKLTFGQRLRRLRESFRFEQTGLSQSELAERAGVAKQQIQQWESDTHLPSWGTVQRLAKALGITTDELGSGT